MNERSAQPQIWVVIPAAGKGTRFGAELPKQYLPLIDDVPVLAYTLACFVDHARIAGVVVAIAADDARWRTLAVSRHARVHAVTGGAERADSVRSALDYLCKQGGAASDDWVLVHDAARPCLSQRALDDLLAALYDDTVGGILALPISDTVKQAADQTIASHHMIERTLDRRTLWLAQTPQMFRVGLLQQSLVAALDAGAVITDEASAIEWAGFKPRLVPGEARNLKITHSDDLALARFHLEAGSRPGGKS